MWGFYSSITNMILVHQMLVREELFPSVFKISMNFNCIALVNGTDFSLFFKPTMHGEE
jgi:hypothetical protein